MGYIEQNLMPGEEVILKAKLHWAMFVSPAFVTGVGLLFFIVSFVIVSSVIVPVASRDNSGVSIVCFGFAGLVLLLGLLNAARAVISYFTTELAVTNKRVIAKTGLLRRRSLEILLSKVESVGVNQPIMGRIFNYGTIVVAGTGGTKQGFPNIVAPMDFRKRINTQIAGPA